MKKSPLFCAVLVCFLLLTLSLHAEDSAVILEADAAGLSLVPPVDLPRGGTYWLVLPGSGLMAPMPCPPLDTSLPIYALSDNGQFLVDQTAGGSGMSAAALLAQANSVSNLILQVQSAATAQAMSRNGHFHSLNDSGGPPSPGGGDYDDEDDFTNAPYVIPWDTNRLWLEITNVANGWAYLNAHHATNQIYVVWATSDLAQPFTNWQMMTEVWPVGDEVTPFTVPVAGNPSLFLRAADVTGLTINGLPLWWSLQSFGNPNYLNYSADDLDAQGVNTLGYDYTNGISPNLFGFSLSVASSYVNTPDVPVQINLTNGMPGEYAVVINGTNLIGADWQPFTGTNLTVTLGAGDGTYNVLVGLRAWAGDPQPVWQGALLDLDTVPPVITITKPPSGTVTQPLITVQGFANELLSRITFDVSNATEVVSNQPGYLTGQFYDAKVLAYTTNWFSCYDLPLVTNGDNLVTVHGFDLAGNETTVIRHYTLVAATNPPVLALVWPLPNTAIGGSHFTLQAMVDDPTATVTASITDTNGDTHVITATVARNGTVWVNNLPLAAGTNLVTLTTTNRSGWVNATNFTVVQSGVQVTVDPISDDQLNRFTVQVTGTVSDPAQNVYVNGVLASQDGDGNWEADNVPVNPGGPAQLNVQTGPDNVDPTSEQNVNQPQPTTVLVASYMGYYADNQHYTSTCMSYGGPYIFNTFVLVQWTAGVGGIMPDGEWGATSPWSADSPPLPPWSYGQNSQASFHIGNTECYQVPSQKTIIASSQARTLLQLSPGDTGTSTGNRLVRLTMTATLADNSAGDPATFQAFGHSFTPTATNASVGELLVAVPNGAMPTFTATVAGQNQYTFTVQANDEALQIIDANTGLSLSGQTNTVIVGQQMNFTAQLSITNSLLTNQPLANFQWTVPGVTVSNYIQDLSSTLAASFATNNSNVLFHWADGASNRVVQCSATVNGKIITAKVSFNVYCPYPTNFSSVILGTVAADTNYTANIDVIGYPFLHFGINFTTNYGIGFYLSNAPVQFWATPTQPSPYGDYFITQIINETTMKRNVIQGTNIVGEALLNDSGLDTRIRLNNITMYATDHNTHYQWGDSPGQGLGTGIVWESRTDSFTSYLMFRPTGGIPIPLYQVNWGWSGTAKTNGLPNSYILTSQTITSPSLSVTHFFPQWTNIANYSVIQTNLPPFNEN